MTNDHAMKILAAATDAADQQPGADIRRFIRALRSVGWQPGHTAPTDRPIDICVNGRRYTDCTYAEAHNRFQRIEWRGTGETVYQATRIIADWPDHWMEILPIPEAVE